MCSGKVPSAVVPTVISEPLFGNHVRCQIYDPVYKVGLPVKAAVFGDKAQGVTKKKLKIAGKNSVGIAFIELSSRTRAVISAMFFFTMRLITCS